MSWPRRDRNGTSAPCRSDNDWMVETVSATSSVAESALRRRIGEFVGHVVRCNSDEPTASTTATLTQASVGPSRVPMAARYAAKDSGASAVPVFCELLSLLVVMGENLGRAEFPADAPRAGF